MGNNNAKHNAGVFIVVLGFLLVILGAWLLGLCLVMWGLILGAQD